MNHGNLQWEEEAMEGKDLVRMLIWAVIIAFVYGAWRFKKRMGMTTKQFERERQDEIMRLHEEDMRRKQDD